MQIKEEMLKMPGENRNMLPGKRRGQVYIAVLIMGFVLSLLALALLGIFKANSLFLVRASDSQKKQELAAAALEHAIYALQQADNWYTIPGSTGLGYNYDKQYTTSLGNYSMIIIPGNLFMIGTTRQCTGDCRTIGIKVKVGTTGMEGEYFAVVLKGGFSAVLLSNGTILSSSLCNNNAINNTYYEFFWGDIYSGNPADGAFNFPEIPVGNGNVTPQPWMPEVYAKGNIYTSLGATSSTNFVFGYTYDDMSPTPKSHPYSPFANVPSMPLEYYKLMAYNNGTYYGPKYIGGTGSPGTQNPYYKSSPQNDITWILNQTNLSTIVSTKLQNTGSSCLFIDTTDAMPLRPTGNINTYTGTLNAASNTLTWFNTNTTNEYYTSGYIFVMGPLRLMGDNPSNGGTTVPNITGINIPNNYYYPQATDGNFFTWTGTPSTSYLTLVKHNGGIYTAGELMIGGSSVTNICIYGQLYIDQYGDLNVDTTSNGTNPQISVYYRPCFNINNPSGNNLQVVTFNEITFLIPTPVPVYPF
jgi:hypothetical protein